MAETADEESDSGRNVLCCLGEMNSMEREAAEAFVAGVLKAHQAVIEATQPAQGTTRRKRATRVSREATGEGRTESGIEGNE